MPVSREIATSARDQYIEQANFFQGEIARYQRLAREATDPQERVSYQRAAESATHNRNHVQGLIRTAEREVAKSVDTREPEADPAPQRPAEPVQEQVPEKRYALDEMLNAAREQARRDREQERDRERGLER